jgi:hypothetical protein
VSATDVLRALYQALSAGDLPAVIACVDPDVIVDEPPELPYGGIHLGRDEFIQSILGVMMGYAAVQLTEFEIFEGETGAVGKLVGTLTAHSTGEAFALTMIEVHEIVGEVTRKIDVYLKDPAALAAFYARSAAASSQ